MYCDNKEYVDSVRKTNWLGITDFDRCPAANDIDLSQLRDQFPMTETVEDFQEVKKLCGLTHEGNMEKFVEEMEREFNQFVHQMRRKFRTLKTLINTRKG